MKRFWNYEQPIWVNIISILLCIMLILGIAFGCMCLNAWLIMLVWNATLPAVFSGVFAITFWQAFGIDLLIWLLFSGIGKTISTFTKN